jgi:starch phosphorylase
LYGGDQHYRLCQEVILGIGGVKMLRALGYHQIKRFHMNEGHASLLTLELLDEEMQRLERPTPAPENIEIVRGQCVFTTHTPVPAGHDQFPRVLVEQVLGRQAALLREELWYEGKLNMTYLALNLSRYVNGVAKSHGEVSRLLFAGYEIDSITNGVHVATWTSPPFQDLYDRYIPGWKQDNFSLRYAFNIPSSDIWQAHSQAKKQLLQYVNRETNAGMQTDVLTIGFGRRATSYKRADLLFQKIERLKEIVARTGPLQLVYAGKAHPRDHEGKVLIQRVFQAKEALHGMITVAYLENYDVAIGKLITAGVDVWLNTPQPPLEASGTSGMKAALNGVPSLSVLDGWWIEGYIERKTGWAIGANERKTAALNDHARDAALLYETLEHAVLPVFYRAREQFIDMMRHCIALNGAFFNTQRMLQEYVLKAYL